MDIPWKNLMSNNEHLHRNAQSCIKTSSPALRQWCGESLPPLFGNPALMVWPPHMYSDWPCRAHQKCPYTVRSIISLQQDHNNPPTFQPLTFNNQDAICTHSSTGFFKSKSTGVDSLPHIELSARAGPGPFAPTFCLLTCWHLIGIQFSMLPLGQLKNCLELEKIG